MSYDDLSQQIAAIKLKYQLVDFGFDTECIYDKGDLSSILSDIIGGTLPELNIKIAEEISVDGQQYIATLSNEGTSMQLYADTFTDWLPDTFFDLLESIPVVFGSEKRYYSINPAIGLTGQETWYFCGTEENLKQARAAGLPLVYPGEDMMGTEEFKRFMQK